MGYRIDKPNPQHNSWFVRKNIPDVTIPNEQKMLRCLIACDEKSYLYFSDENSLY